ncbi:ABC transporter permease [Amycolatopsis suaedae]|uniref:ABC transporter permease n=1 Tax=Amycolatopsis suaedae TaxID=2510978 RepID=A0A4Q7J9F6_9PSEU|nr:ABC transporter permease subunit [Amycolatopsis suaedae]RZQ63043.1 ABC transporter permease [Amycolatopsis suaedae]
MITAEIRRLRTTRLWWWVLAAAGTGLFVTALAAVGPENFDPPLPGLDSEQGTRVLLGILGFTAGLPALLGSTTLTSEYRHGTITTTYLYQPRRGRVLLAKLTAGASFGLAYGLLATAVAGAGLYAVAGGKLGLPPSTVAELLLRITVGMACYTALGVAVGALLRGQVATLATLGAYLYVVEPALLVLPGAGQAYPYLPGGATSALTGFGFLTEQAAAQTGTTAATLLPAVGGAAVLLGYLAVAAVLAALVTLRRDVT